MYLSYSRLYVLGVLLLLALGLFWAYSLQLADTNEYMGYSHIEGGGAYLFLSGFALLAIGFSIPIKIKQPSDLFLFFYGLFVLFPYAVLYQNRLGEIGGLDFIWSFTVLFVPYFTVKIAAFFPFTMKFPGVLRLRVAIWLLVFLCCVGVFNALLHAPNSAGFGIDSVYERRIEGREIFSAGTLVAYINASVVNGYAPFLAFVACWKRRFSLLVFSAFCGLSYFYTVGFKAPLFFIALAAVFGYSVMRQRVFSVTGKVYLLLLIVFFVFFVEYFSNGFSLVADYFIRRALSLPPYIASAYFEFMSSEGGGWSFLKGVNNSSSIAYLVGEQFFHSADTSANTNAFLYQLGTGGLPMYVFTVFLVTVFFVLINAAYTYKKNPMLLYIGLSYSLLLTEQAATTALISSGMGLLAACAVFLKKR